MSGLITSVGQLGGSAFIPQDFTKVGPKHGVGPSGLSFQDTLAEQITQQAEAVLYPPTAQNLRIEPASTNPIGQMVDSVQGAQNRAMEATHKLLSGQGGSVHESITAMEEASISFQLMVEMRNKIVESLQELMRMQI
jgi:flagellar hook-basal body complex protein FliE